MRIFTLLLRKSLADSSGMSLLETVVASGMLSIVLLTSSSMITTINSSRTKQQISYSRDQIIGRIRSTVLTVPALKNSAALTASLGNTGVPLSGGTVLFPHYQTLSLCHPDDTTQSGCDRSTLDVSPHGNYFYLTTAQGANPATAPIIAGENIYYTGLGQLCSQTDALDPNKCPLFARTWFEPFCLQDGTTITNTCNKALSMTVRYAVGTRQGYTRGPSVSTFEGEIYVPLQKGIQVTRLLDQTGTELPFSNGMYRLAKDVDGTSAVLGIRIESLVTNPLNLTNFTVQVRSVTGTAAYNLQDQQARTALAAASWSAVAAFPAITSLGALQNQNIVFGTYGGTNAMWPITGKWTIAGGVPVAPSFKSGFYQFRVVATDQSGGTFASTNFLTVRILPVPEVLLVQEIPAVNERDCHGSAKFHHKYFAVDDEGLTQVKTAVTGPASTLPKLNTHDLADHRTIYPDPTSAGNINIDLDWPASTDYSVSITAKNAQTTVTTVARSFALHDVPRSFVIEEDPATIRINSSDTVRAVFTAGTCCTPTGGVTWSFPAVPIVESATPAPTFTGDTSSTFGTCTRTGNQKRCPSNLSVEATKTNANMAPNITAEISAQVDACALSAVSATRNIKVLGVPTITFRTPDSIWMSLPAAEQLSGNPKAFSETLLIKSDFPPLEPVSVKVTREGSEAALCSVTFAAGVGNDPVYEPCTVPSGTHGALTLKPVGANVALTISNVTATHRAALGTSTNHYACWANLTSSANYPATYTVPSTRAMTLSPWNSLVAGANDDEGNWNTGNQKKYRCYDHWTGSNLPDNEGPAPTYSNQQDNFNSVDLHNAVHPAAPVYLERKGFHALFRFFSEAGTANWSEANIPTLFIVARGPAEGHFTLEITNIMQTNDAPLDDITSTFCPNTLTSRLYSKRLRGSDDPVSSFFEINQFQMRASQLGYIFMCTYGHWNPYGKASSPNE